MKPKSSVIRQFPVPPELKRAFAGACKTLGVLQRDVLRELIAAWVEKNSVDGRKRKK